MQVSEKKASRISGIVECAFGLFAEKGIESISMNEIAEQAKIGVASLYRYFTTKEDLAIEVAIYAWRMEKDFFGKIFDTDDYRALTGFEQLKAVLEIFEEALVTQRSFFSFVYYFDSFVKKEKVSLERLASYEAEIGEVNEIVINALERGRRDGSITFRHGENAVLAGAADEEVYFTLLHSIFCLAQKLSLSGELLDMDKIASPKRQMEILINAMLEALR